MLLPVTAIIEEKFDIVEDNMISHHGLHAGKKFNVTKVYVHEVSLTKKLFYFIKRLPRVIH